MAVTEVDNDSFCVSRDESSVYVWTISNSYYLLSHLYNKNRTYSDSFRKAFCLVYSIAFLMEEKLSDILLYISNL